MNREETWLLKEKYNGLETEGFYTDCESLQKGVPVAYLIGSIPFLNTTIFLDSHPLIPRPETEFWVEKAITDIQDSGIESPKVLDLCAGSGCIGVAILKALPETTVDFIEIDANHLQTIEKNCIENGIGKGRYTIEIGDLFSSKPNHELKYNFILSNPPYINASLKQTDESVLANEPHVALFGGSNGLEIIERIVSQSKEHLTSQGVLYIEHEPEQIEAIEKLALRYHFKVTTCTDQYNIVRFSTFTVS